MTLTYHIPANGPCLECCGHHCGHCLLPNVVHLSAGNAFVAPYNILNGEFDLTYAVVPGGIPTTCAWGFHVGDFTSGGVFHQLWWAMRFLGVSFAVEAIDAFPLITLWDSDLPDANFNCTGSSVFTRLRGTILPAPATTTITVP